MMGRDGESGDVPAGKDGPAELGYDVVVRRLDYALSERVLLACAKRGENFDPARQFTTAHAYARPAMRDEFERNLYGGWDPTGALFDALWLSRLVHDNATTTEFAVRRIVRNDGEERLVPFDAYDSHVAYKLRTDERDWLTDEELAELARLLKARHDRSPGDRVRRALHYSEAATRERFLEDAQPLIVRGLEALLKVGRKRLQRQFAQRTVQLGAELGVSIDAERCSQAYDDRSALVHGAHVDLTQAVQLDEFGETMGSLQAILRAAGRRALEDAEFAAVFEHDKAIVDRWPATYVETF